MKIVVFEAEEWERRACARLRSAHDLQCTSDALDGSNASAYRHAEIVSTFVNSRLDARVLAQFADLKLIATRSTGYDHIDLDWCAAHGVTVANVPDYGDATVAAIADVAWQGIEIEDYRHPELSSRRSVGLRALQWYVARLQRATHADPAVTEQFYRVIGFLDPPPALFRPRTLFRVLKPRPASLSEANLPG